MHPPSPIVCSKCNYLIADRFQTPPPPKKNKVCSNYCFTANTLSTPNYMYDLPFHHFIY